MRDFYHQTHASAELGGLVSLNQDLAGLGSLVSTLFKLTWTAFYFIKDFTEHRPSSCSQTVTAFVPVC